MAAPFLFFLLATVAVAAAVGMLIARNPVSSALWLVLNLFCIAGLYLTMNASFIGVIQILVYAGAIMVLFLFVIMLLNLQALPQLGEIEWTKVAAFVLGMVILAQLVYIIAVGLDVPVAPVEQMQAAETGSAEVLGQVLFTEYALHLEMAGTETGSAEVLGQVLFTEYALHLEMAGILLLAATIGAVMLAQRRFE